MKNKFGEWVWTVIVTVFICLIWYTVKENENDDENEV